MHCAMQRDRKETYLFVGGIIRSEMIDVFICYSRTDSSAADRVEERLRAQGCRSFSMRKLTLVNAGMRTEPWKRFPGHRSTSVRRSSCGESPPRT